RFTLDGGFGQVFSLALSPDGKRVAAGTDCPTLRLWEVETGKVVPTELGENAAQVNCVAFTPDGKRLLAGAGAFYLRLWDSGTWKQAGSWKGSASSLSFSPDGRRVAAVPSYEKAVRVLAVESGECALRLPRPEVAYVWRAVFSQDGRVVISVD